MRIAPDSSKHCAPDSFADSGIAPDSCGPMPLGIGAAADLFCAARAAEGASPHRIASIVQHRPWVCRCSWSHRVCDSDVNASATQATACGGSAASRDVVGSNIVSPRGITSRRYPFNSIVDDGMRLITV